MTSEINPAQTKTSSNREANYVLAVLFVVIMLDFLDRQVILIFASRSNRELRLLTPRLG